MWDATVFGAGVMGLSCAWEMTRRGARVRVIDPHGVGAGASGGVVGALAPHVPEGWNPKKAFQLDSLLGAETFWQSAEAAGGGATGYGRTGRLQPIADLAALALARARAEGARQLWGDAAEWQVIPADSAGPWAPASPTGWLIHDTLTARLHPARTCAALAAAIRALGGTISPEGIPGAEPALWATGTAGLAELSQGRPRPVGAGVKGQAALLDLERRTAPQLFAGGVHIVPHADGTTAIGSTSERDFIDGAATDDSLEAVIAAARAACPALAQAPVIARWAGIRPRARSRAPMLGPWPGRPGHFIANGGFKIGFGIAPGAACLIADLMLNGDDRIPAPFRVEASF